jgi:hypothetical protein
MTLYSTAMRRAELCRLKVRDIDSQRMMIRIHQGKGGRDRDVLLSPKLLENLWVYWRWMKPQTYLFPGTVNGWRADVPISANSSKPLSLTRCATVAPLICSKRERTSVPFSSCWAIPNWSTRSSTCICRKSICRLPRIPWSGWNSRR